jgi:hypothetical protein
VKKFFAVMLVFLLTLFLLPSLLLAEEEGNTELGVPTYTEVWDGRGMESEDENDGSCPEEGNMHWVFANKGNATYAGLHIGEQVFGPSEPLNAEVWHFNTQYFPDIENMHVEIRIYGGDPGPGGGLVLSNYCIGEKDENGDDENGDDENGDKKDPPPPPPKDPPTEDTTPPVEESVTPEPTTRRAPEPEKIVAEVEELPFTGWNHTYSIFAGILVALGLILLIWTTTRRRTTK